VERLEDVAAFVTNVRRGRPGPPEVVEEVRRRLARIGGSPLMKITCDQAHALEQRLGIPVAVAGRLWGPYPAEVLADLARAGVTRVLSLPLAPQSVHVYNAAVREALPEDMSLIEAPPYGLEPALVDAFVETIEEAAPAAGGWEARPAVVLTAHSLPRRVVDAGDPYERDFRAMAERVAERIRPRGVEVGVAFQSQGMTGDAWLGPDLPATFADLFARGHRAVLVAPIGFVAEHLETLFDLDVEAPELARRAGLTRFARAAAVGARTRFIDGLEAVARAALAA
jgi:ferrochelatase